MFPLINYLHKFQAISQEKFIKSSIKKRKCVKSGNYFLKLKLMKNKKLIILNNKKKNKKKNLFSKNLLKKMLNKNKLIAEKVA